jgi:serine/threonine protein kinase
MAVTYKASDKDALVIQDITDRILRRMGEWYGSASELSSRTPEIRSYTNSFLLRYDVRTQVGNKTILVKIRRNPKMESLVQAIHAREIHANIPDEYKTLKFVYERIGDGHANFTAIRSLAYFEDYFAIVMEEFPSRSIRQLLYEQKKNGHSSELLNSARKAGQLLRFFHERVYAIVETPYRESEILADVESYAARLERYTGGRVHARSIMDAFGQTLARHELRSIPFSAAHQDMTSDNVLYSNDGRVCLIDIKTKPAPIYSDLALLLVHPQTFRDQIFRGGRYFAPELLQEYRQAILAGYFGEQRIDHFLVNIFCAFRILDKWTMHAELLHRYRGLKRLFTRPLAPIVSAEFRRVMSSYLDAAN